MSTESLLVAVVAGVITSIFIHFSLMVYRRILAPLYQKITYQGISVNGQWVGKVVTPAGSKADGIADIEQAGDKLFITLTFSVKRESESEIEQRVFKGQGSLYNRLILFTAQNVNEAQIGCRTYLLEVVEGGEKLVGF